MASSPSQTGNTPRINHSYVDLSPTVAYVENQSDSTYSADLHDPKPLNRLVEHVSPKIAQSTLGNNLIVPSLSGNYIAPQADHFSVEHNNDFMASSPSQTGNTPRINHSHVDLSPTVAYVENQSDSTYSADLHDLKPLNRLVVHVSPKIAQSTLGNNLNVPSLSGNNIAPQADHFSVELNNDLWSDFRMSINRYGIEQALISNGIGGGGSPTQVIDHLTPGTPVNKTILETRGGFNENIYQRIRKVYAYSAAALAITTLSAMFFAKTHFVAVLLTAMSSSLIPLIGITFVSVGLMAATILTPGKYTLLKHGLYGMFAVWQGLIVSPLAWMNPVAFVAASTTSALVTGGLGLLSMNLENSLERYERILMVGLGAIGLVSLGAVFLGGVVERIAREVSIVGGLALFSAVVVYDTHKARSEAHLPEFDTIEHSMNIYQNALNLLIRFWETVRK